jgi:hypothetical protein
MTKQWTRRAFLRSAGVTGAAACVASLIPRPLAEAAVGPKRLVLVTSGQGTDISRWRPTGGETDFTLSYILEPFAAYREQLLILDGIDNAIAYENPGNGGGHFGMGTLWTGVSIPAGDVNGGLGWPQAPSVDRLVAAHVGGETPFDAFYWGTWPISLRGSNQGANGMAHYRGADQPIEPELYPDRAFDRLFGAVIGDEGATARLRAERRSVLDLVTGELGRVRAELDVGDQERLDAHLAGFRTLETRLESMGELCVAPTRSRTFTESEMKSFALQPLLTELQFRMMSTALACDLTRVACFQWPHSEGTAPFMEAAGYPAMVAGLHTTAHSMSYTVQDDGTFGATEEERGRARRDMANLNRWRSEMITQHLLGSMSPDVLSNTLFVWASEMAEGGTHSNRNVPVVVVQGADVAAFRTGRYLRWGTWDPFATIAANSNNAEHGGEPSNKLLVSICQAMGMSDIDRVGDSRIESGPLPRLV